LNRSHAVAVLALLSLQFGCGGESPITPDAPVASVPTPTPRPAPTSAPAVAASGVCPNGNPVVATFDIKVFSVIDVKGEIRPWEGGPIFVGEIIRFDSQGHGRVERRTNGCSPEGPRWDWSPEDLVRWSGDFGWNPRAKVLAPGTLTVWATMDGVEADFKLVLKLEEGQP
jgi:hypothetical protein